MSRFCIVSKRKVMFGHNVSHANNKTKRRFLPNLQNCSVYSKILDKTFSFRLSTRGLRTIDFHGGFDEYLISTRNSKLDPLLKKIKKHILSKQ